MDTLAYVDSDSVYHYASIARWLLLVAIVVDTAVKMNNFKQNVPISFVDSERSERLKTRSVKLDGCRSWAIDTIIHATLRPTQW